MGREQGILPISANFEPNIAEPFDGRARVQLLSDLTDIATFGVYAYIGMDVNVYDDTEDNNGKYLLKALPYTNIANWEKLGSGGGGVSDHSLLINRDIAGNHSKIIPEADSTTAFQIMKADGTTPMATFDSVNDRVIIDRNITVKDQQLDTDAYNGVIYKGIYPFIHNFRHPTGNTQRPAGSNLCIGWSTGNLTMGSTATITRHGSYNTLIGTYVTPNITTGHYNTVIGTYAGMSLTTGYENTIIGLSAMQTITDAYSNTAIGMQAGYQGTSVNNCVFIGYRSAHNTVAGGDVKYTTGTGSIYIGSGAKPSNNNVNNEIVIGYVSEGKGSNTVTIGNASITDTFINGVLNTSRIKPVSDSTTAFQIMKADGITPMLNIDTENETIGLRGIVQTASNTVSAVRIDGSGATSQQNVAFLRGGSRKWFWGLGVEETNPSLIAYSDDLTSTVFRISATTGNVGINTLSDATEKLEVNGNIKCSILNSTGGILTNRNAEEQAEFKRGNDGNNIVTINGRTGFQNWLRFRVADTTKWLVGMFADENFTIFDTPNATSVFTINKTTDNVGIGTTTPSEKLDVNGNIKANGLVVNDVTGATAGNHIKFTARDEEVVMWDTYGKQTGSKSCFLHRTFGKNSTGNDAQMGLFYCMVDDDTAGSETSSWQFFTTHNGTPRKCLDLVGRGITVGVGGIKTLGNVGIGTTTPLEALDVNGTIISRSGRLEANADNLGHQANLVLRTYLNSSSIQSSLTFVSARGSLASPNNSLSDDRLMAMYVNGYDGTALSSKARIMVQADGNWSSTNHGTKLSIALTPTNSTSLTDVFTALGNGNVWVAGNLSADSFTDRTPYPKDLQTAIDAVMSMERLPDGEYEENNKKKQLDHSKLHTYIQGDGEELNRDMSATISAQNEVIKFLLSEVRFLKDEINTIKEITNEKVIM